MRNLLNSGSMHVSESFTGAIDYPLMNDYMFRSVMQSNGNVLKGFLCSLLHLNPGDVRTVQILNPIELGERISDKEFILDIKILMNDDTVIDLELQVNNQYNWPERSLSYLCRLFDGLNAGEEYRESKAAFQIGILNFTIFPKHPEFFSTYQIMNVKNYQKYSDKFTIHVLDLTKTDIATEEDRKHGLDRWAKLFHALTWEDFMMVAEGNKSMQEAGKTMFSLNQDDQIRYQCEARERYSREWNEVNHRIDRLQTENAEKDMSIIELKLSNEKKDSHIARLEEQVAELRRKIQRNADKIKGE